MTKLSTIERKIWIDFHKFAYKDDIKLADTIIKKHPRWAIISAYYAMHDIANLYLGKNYNIKITGPEVHKKTITELKRVIKNKRERERILSLFKKAEKEVREIQPDSISYLLLIGKKERGKAQYYSPKSLIDNACYVKKADWFVNKIAKVFIKIIEKMVC